MNEARQIALSVGTSLLVVWLLLAAFLLLARPRSASLGELLRLLPDTIRLLRRLAVDPAVPRPARIRLWLAAAGAHVSHARAVRDVGAAAELVAFEEFGAADGPRRLRVDREVRRIAQI